jgi:hypothetical protein
MTIIDLAKEAINYASFIAALLGFIVFILLIAVSKKRSADYARVFKYSVFFSVISWGLIRLHLYARDANGDNGAGSAGDDDNTDIIDGGKYVENIRHKSDYLPMAQQGGGGGGGGGVFMPMRHHHRSKSERTERGGRGERRHRHREESRHGGHSRPSSIRPSVPTIEMQGI